MENRRLRLIYLVLLPALLVAACVLGYYSYVTARQFERLGEHSIAESSLLILADKAERIEQLIIAADNQAFSAIDLDDPSAVQDWKQHAEELSPSIRALIVLDNELRIVGYAARASAVGQREFRRLFATRILQDLELEGLGQNRLKHLHRSYGESNYLISYKRVPHDDTYFYLIAHHDTGYLVRNVFVDALPNEQGQPTTNVIDEDNRRVFGPSLEEGGDYVVGTSIDHHNDTHYHLNAGCINSYLYSFSGDVADGDAGYDTSLGLGSWTTNGSCDGNEGGRLFFYAAMR